MEKMKKMGGGGAGGGRSEAEKEWKEALVRKVTEVGEANKRRREWDNPGKVVEILEKVGGGVPLRRVRDEYGLSWGDLCRLRVEYGALIKRRKEMAAEDALELAEGARMLMMRKMEMMADDDEKLEATPFRELSVSYGIFMDKHHVASEGLDGMGKRDEGAGRAVSLADAVKAIEEAKALLLGKGKPEAGGVGTEVEVVVSEQPGGVGGA